jgi:hypothetical protein
MRRKVLPDEDRVRRVSAEFIGDEATELELLEVSIGLGEAGKTKGERDARLVRLALMALKREIEACRTATGKRYPRHAELEDWLAGQQTKEP